MEGDVGSGMFVILDGAASVEWRGGSVDLNAGMFFGELTLLAPGGRRNARVRAATEMRCLAIPRDTALELIESEPPVALAMLREVARRFASAPGRVTLLTLSGGGQADRNQADRGEPPRAARLRAHRARRGGRGPHRDRGEVRPRRSGPARAGLRGHPERRGLADRASISEYAQGGPLGHQSDRDRKLLLHRSEIDSLYGKVREKGLTLVPTRMYFKDGRVKVEGGARPRMRTSRQAPRRRRARRPARDRARPQAPPLT